MQRSAVIPQKDSKFRLMTQRLGRRGCPQWFSFFGDAPSLNPTHSSTAAASRPRAHRAFRRAKKKAADIFPATHKTIRSAPRACHLPSIVHTYTHTDFTRQTKSARESASHADDDDDDVAALSGNGPGPVRIVALRRHCVSTAACSALVPMIRSGRSCSPSIHLKAAWQP